MIFVYVTSNSAQKAKEISKLLLEKKLIACANIFPSESIYTWEGKIKEEKEYILILKTLEEKFELIEKEISRVHPYETPCIAKVKVDFSKKFFDWLKKTVS